MGSPAPAVAVLVCAGTGAGAGLRMPCRAEQSLMATHRMRVIGWWSQVDRGSVVLRGRLLLLGRSWSVGRLRGTAQCVNMCLSVGLQGLGFDGLRKRLLDLRNIRGLVLEVVNYFVLYENMMGGS